MRFRRRGMAGRLRRRGRRRGFGRRRSFHRGRRRSFHRGRRRGRRARRNSYSIANGRRHAIGTRW